MSVTELVLCPVQVQDSPVYQHELDKFFLYYNSSQAALVLGPLHSQGLLKVRLSYGAVVTSKADYSRVGLFVFSNWKQWEPRLGHFVDNRKLSHVRPQCVDENFGFCSSGYLRPQNPQDILVFVTGPNFDWNELIDFSVVYFKLLDGVFHNLRPVYEMGVDDNRTSMHNANQRYLFHKNGKWRVGMEIGSESIQSRIVLEMEGNATRVEYEKGKEWYRLDYGTFHSTRRPTRTWSFGRLECSRQLPDGINCESEGTTACGIGTGSSCHIDSNGISSCHCAAGYRGIQCEHRVPQCTASLEIPTKASSMFESKAPHYDGNIVTVFCFPVDAQYYHYYLVCLNGSWQSTSKTGCNIATATTLPTTKALRPVYNDSGPQHVGGDSSGTIATVVVVLVCVQLGFPFLCYCCIVCCQSDEEKIDEEVTADNEQKKSSKHTTSLKRTCSGFFYLCWWVWLVVIIVYFVWYGNIPLDGSTVFSAVVIMAFVCLGVLYCCVFSESFLFHEYDYLTELENEQVTAGEQIAEMKAAKPTVTFKAECSHNETKTRRV